jgi:hypothetical protein
MRRLLVSIGLVAAFAVFLLLPEEPRGLWLGEDPEAPGQSLEELDQALERVEPGPRQTIAGQVRLLGGEPVAGVTVRLEHAWVPEVRAVTDAEGRFELAPEEPRGELVVASADWVFLGGERIVAEGVTDGYLLAVARPRELAGRVVDPDGAPISAADVTVRPPADVLVPLGLPSLPLDGPGRSTLTDSNGGFSLGPLPDVEGLTVEVRAAGYRGTEVHAPAVPEASGDGVRPPPAPLTIELEPDAD